MIVTIQYIHMFMTLRVHVTFYSDDDESNRQPCSSLGGPLHMVHRPRKSPIHGTILKDWFMVDNGCSGSNDCDIRDTHYVIDVYMYF